MRPAQGRLAQLSTPVAKYLRSELGQVWDNRDRVPTVGESLCLRSGRELGTLQACNKDDKRGRCSYDGVQEKLTQQTLGRDTETQVQVHAASAKAKPCVPHRAFETILCLKQKEEVRRSHTHIPSMVKTPW